MIYVAQKVLETADTIYSPGDAIVEFPKWDPMVQRAHLNLGNVERVHGELGDRPTGRSRAELRKERDKEEARLRRIEDALAGDEGTGTLEDGDNDDDEEGADRERAIPDVACLPDDMFTCPACEGSVYTTPAGLLRHADQEHGGTVPKKGKKSKVNDKRFAKLAPEPSPEAIHITGDLAGANVKASKPDDE